MTTLWHDIRYSLRMLRKNLGITAIAVDAARLDAGDLVGGENLCLHGRSPVCISAFDT